jgi:predicted MFS family arabinose efflux permease
LCSKRSPAGSWGWRLGLVGHAALGERLGRNQRFSSTGGVLAAGLMGLIGYFLSYRAIFLVAAALVLPLLFALGRIQPSDIHFGRACGVPDHHGASAPPRMRHRSVWMNRGLLTFAGCVFLFQMANASMLPLAGESLVYSEVPFSSLIVSALIIVPQVIVALMAPWAGRRSKTWGRRPLLLVGFAALPIRALLFAWTANPIILIAAQVLDGVSGTMLGVLTALIVADLTKGTGRFNLAQGFVGTVSGVGASLSTTLSSLVAASLGRAAGFLGIAAVALAAVRRPAGSVNRYTGALKELFLQAADEVGDRTEIGENGELDGNGGALAYLKVSAITERKR